MSEIFDESQIFSYLDGNLSPDERKRFEKLLQSSPEFRAKFQELSHLYRLSENYKNKRTSMFQLHGIPCREKLPF